jgi:hypothetical protein
MFTPFWPVMALSFPIDSIGRASNFDGTLKKLVRGPSIALHFSLLLSFQVHDTILAGPEGFGPSERP